VETLREAIRILDQVVHQVSSGKNVVDSSHAIWETYRKAEYSVMMIRLHLALENPGRPSVRTNVEDNDLAVLIEASDELTSALKSAEAGDYQSALESVRRGRNILRETLLAIRKIRT
jgi:hypothetical protein